MPWSYPDNVPPSIKYLKPSIQKKAIAISNHILQNTGDEGKSIAIGISKAKSVHDKKSLVKLAFILPVGGAILGGYIGSKFGKNNQKKNRNKKIGAWGGLLAGLGGEIGIAKLIRSKKFTDFAHKQNFKRKQEYYEKQYNKHKNDNFVPPPTRYRRSAINLTEFFKEHQGDHTAIKTKLEAKKFYYKTARKYHPDVNPGVSPEKIKKLNTDWEGVENTDWFHKLASFKNTRFYKELLKALKKGDKDFLVDKVEQVKEKVPLL